MNCHNCIAWVSYSDKLASFPEARVLVAKTAGERVMSMMARSVSWGLEKGSEKREGATVEAVEPEFFGPEWLEIIKEHPQQTISVRVGIDLDRANHERHRAEVLDEVYCAVLEYLTQADINRGLALLKETREA